MKVVLGILVFGLVSCGELPVEQEGLAEGLGQNLEANPDAADNKFSSQEVKDFTSVCNAIVDKEFVFNDRIRTNTTVTVESEVHVKGCGEGEFAKEGSFDVTLSENNGDLIFGSNDSTVNFYGNVLTAESKQLADFCDEDTELTNETTRFVLNGSFGIWYQVLGNRSGACGNRLNDESEPLDNSTICVVLRTAKKQTNGSSYTITNVELFEINVDDNSDRGLVVKRSYATDSSCEGEESQETVQLNSL